MNFLDQIWLIPLFPLFGAALMLFFGKLLDPQPVSEVAIAPGVEPVYEHGHGHARAALRTRDMTVTGTTAMAAMDIIPRRSRN